MWGSMRSDRFPRLYTYEQAVAKEAEIVPYSKGKIKGDKPLAERRRSWLTIRKVGDDVAVRLYNTNIITYKPSGEIIVNQGGWNTGTTHETVARILGTTIFQRHFDNWIACKDGTFILRKEGDNVFRRSSSYGVLEYQNPVYPVVHRLKRKEYNNVRKRYADFIQYGLGLIRLGREAIVFEQVPRTEAYKRENLTNLMLSDNVEDKYWAFNMLFSDFRSRYSRYSGMVRVDGLLNRVRNVLVCAHKDEVLETIEVRDGRIVRDRYSWVP